MKFNYAVNDKCQRGQYNRDRNFCKKCERKILTTSLPCGKIWQIIKERGTLC